MQNNPDSPREPRNEQNDWHELRGKLSTFTVWAISGLIDSTFLALWVGMQWLVNEYVIVPLQLSSLDHWMLTAFQILFAVSTMLPIIMYIYDDDISRATK